MRYLQGLPLLLLIGLSLAAAAVQAADEDAFLGKILPQSEQTVGRGHSALWTFPHIATQYQPAHTPPQLQRALQAQHEGRYLDALILLDEVSNTQSNNKDVKADCNLLRASFLLQDKRTLQAVEILSPLIADHSLHAADALALTAMTHLQQGQTQEALTTAQRALEMESIEMKTMGGDGLLPHLAFSYALQAVGRLTEARAVMHRFNTPTAHAPLPNATSLAREAELALTLNDISAANTLIKQAVVHPSLASQPYAQPYVTSVSGLVALISGDAQPAKAAFETALQRDPKDARALLGMGLAAIQLGDNQAGLKNLRAANEADPGNALILTYLGRVQQQLGQTAAARSSWQQAQQADPKDPNPWLYQAQAQLQAKQPAAARESLRQAQTRTAYRAVYRGENLLQEDAQLLQINTAEALRMQGLDDMAFHALSDGVGEKNAANLRAQADVLQNIRFAQSARRSVALQSLFNDTPGNIPLGLDVFGDGAGQTGASTPQHGVVSGLNAQQASYHDYGALFAKRNLAEVDGIVGNQGTQGGQARMGVGVGSDKVGLSFAYRQFETDGISRFNNLDNSIFHSVLQWRPLDSTQAFVSYQTFNSLRGETLYPADPINNGVHNQVNDISRIMRLGLRYSLGKHSELRGLISHQKTNQEINYQWMSDFLPPPNNTIPEQGLTFGTNHSSSTARSIELQYRHTGTNYAMQSGVSSVRSPLHSSAFGIAGPVNIAQQIYMSWQQALNPYWQLEAGLAYGKNDKDWDTNSTALQRWLPKLGMVYVPNSTTHLRLAAWKNLDAAAVGNASLESANLVGITLNRYSDTYKLIQGIALRGDKQLNASWLLEGKVQQRQTDEPFIDITQKMNRVQIDESHLALNWQPVDLPWTVALTYYNEHIQYDPIYLSSNSVEDQRLRSQQLNLHWLASSQLTAKLALSRNLITAKLDSFDANANPILLDVRDRFNQADASLNWQLSQAGSVDIGLRNATNKSFQYTDIDPLTPRFSKGRLWYAKLKLAW